MKKNIIEAIKMGVSFIKPWGDKIRCFDTQMGYGQYIDLTSTEYDILQKVTNLTIEEQLKRLDEYMYNYGKRS